ncbi:MAG TPA: hypothetical protein VFQ53_28840 [Kofleriaceae bacterium]|nr:hypothetical protein [Kofleriaceae bacterium]
MSPASLSVESLLTEAAEIGETWARDCANQLRAQDRELVGAWPGTVREARRRVLARLHASRVHLSVDTEGLQVLARAAYDAARRSWAAVAEPDPES